MDRIQQLNYEIDFRIAFLESKGDVAAPPYSDSAANLVFPKPVSAARHQMMACRPLSAMTLSSLSAGPAGRVSPCSHLRTVEAVVCKWSANTGWLKIGRASCRERVCQYV